LRIVKMNCALMARTVSVSRSGSEPPIGGEPGVAHVAPPG